jgi:molybdate transport system permease protein
MNFRNPVVLGGITTFIVFLLFVFTFSHTFILLKGGVRLEGIASPILRSISISTITSFIAILIGIPVAYFLSRKEFFLKKAVETFLELPLVLSPVALGTLLLILFSKGGGRFLEEKIGFTFTMKGIIMAQFFVVFTIGLKTLKVAFDELPERYEHIAGLLGASETEVFLDVVLRASKRGILSAFILTWVRSMGEFGASLTIGGMNPSIRIATVELFEKLEMGDLPSVGSIIFVLLTLSFIFLYILKLLWQKGQG